MSFVTHLLLWYAKQIKSNRYLKMANPLLLKLHAIQRNKCETKPGKEIGDVIRKNINYIYKTLYFITLYIFCKKMFSINLSLKFQNFSS